MSTEQTIIEQQDEIWNMALFQVCFAAGNKVKDRKNNPDHVISSMMREVKDIVEMKRKALQREEQNQEITN